VLTFPTAPLLADASIELQLAHAIRLRRLLDRCDARHPLFRQRLRRVARLIGDTDGALWHAVDALRLGTGHAGTVEARRILAGEQRRHTGTPLTALA